MKFSHLYYTRCLPVCKKNLTESGFDLSLGRKMWYTRRKQRRREAADMDRKWLEERLRELPVVQYEFFDTAELTFTPRVRMVCETDCARYGTSWACPPAVGTVEECRERCLSYPHALLITTMNEVDDIADLESTLATRAPHEEITRQVNALFHSQGVETYPLSTESCAICRECAYPHGPCRCPEKMFPCVESHGILIVGTAEKLGIEFQPGGNIVTWFSLILYR